MQARLLPLLFSLFSFSVFWTYSASAQQFSLEECHTSTCFKLVHNKQIGIATLVLWEGKNTIIDIKMIELASDAELVSQVLTNSEKDESVKAWCEKGACSQADTSTYESKTEIVTITKTLIYYDAALVDVAINVKRLLKEDLGITVIKKP